MCMYIHVKSQKVLRGTTLLISVEKKPNTKLKPLIFLLLTQRTKGNQFNQVDLIPQTRNVPYYREKLDFQVPQR